MVDWLLLGGLCIWLFAVSGAFILLSALWLSWQERRRCPLSCDCSDHCA